MQRASLADHQHPGLPPLPPPPPVRASRPPTLPPPPTPSARPAPPVEAPLPSFRTSGPDLEPLASGGSSAHGTSDSEPAEATEVVPHGAVWPPSDPPALLSRELHAAPRAPDPQALPRAPEAQTALRAPELRAPALPAFSLSPAPSVLSALKQRVRFAGGEVPLWSLLSPMVILLALGSAFVAAAVGRPDDIAPAPNASASASSSAAPPVALPSARSSAVEAAPEAPATTQAPALPATSIDTEALEARHAEELTKDEALALASARRQREVARVALLRQKLTRDPGLFKDAATLAELRRAAEDPLTAPDALGAMAEAPGPLSADLLYEMWTGTVVRNGATELARSLVFSKEVRAKASPELAIALDLRIAETCEQNRELLPRVLEKGDRRSLALLAKLARRFGCGANKRLDCYPCLHEDKSVDDAMAAVKKRREPKPFSGR